MFDSGWDAWASYLDIVTELIKSTISRGEVGALPSIRPALESTGEVIGVFDALETKFLLQSGLFLLAAGGKYLVNVIYYASDIGTAVLWHALANRLKVFP